jgi:hypothetical protein
MNKNNSYKLRFNKFQVQSFFISTLLLTFSLPFLSVGAIAQETNKQPETTEQSSTTTRRSESSILAAIWKLIKSKREQEPALSSRSNICEITPGLLGERNLIYSDRPLFLWQGTASELAINLYTPFSLEAEQELMWSQIVKGDSQSVLYAGAALQAGRIYDWEIVVDAQENQRRISFQVMDQEERARIASELEQLETQLASAGATAEEIALEKAHFFAEQDLWSDALQQLYALENPSPEVRSNAQEITAYVCQSEQAHSTI